MNLHKITDRISYLPASNSPLSSDVGIISGNEYTWIFDVGCCDNALQIIDHIPGRKNIILSHFHLDHTGNMERICRQSICHIYGGSYTTKKFTDATAITTPITLEDGIKLSLFPIPCTHAKGSLGLEIDEEYAFLGDSIYGMNKNGQSVFNVSLLNETIGVLKNLHARFFLLSHDTTFVHEKDEVIDRLTRIYQLRKTGEALINIPIV